MTDPRRAEDWDARYGQHQVWSGHVNPTLVEVAESLTPGRALDLACGEGGDALWLAERGWSVTAVDFSAVALARLAAAAADRGVSDRIQTVVADLAQYSADGEYDLVSTHYLHETEPVRRAAFAAAARATSVGGTLLIVGHSPAEDRTGTPVEHSRWDGPWAVEAAGLEEHWQVHAEERERREDDAHGHGRGPAHRADTIVVARRLA